MEKLISDELIKRIQNAKSVVVMTGAGISSESGIPVYRGKQNIWKGYQPEELSNIKMFNEKPELVWEWYRLRRDLIRKADPNPGHLALAKLEKWLINSGKEFCLITQNVDGLHRRSGNKNIFDLHGNIMDNKCLICGFSTSEDDFERVKLPKCPKCSFVLKPGVVSFGEKMPEKELNNAFQASRNCDVFIYTGTSPDIYPSAVLPFEAKSSGAYVVEISEERSRIADIVDDVILGKSGIILPEIVDNLDLGSIEKSLIITEDSKKKKSFYNEKIVTFYTPKQVMMQKAGYSRSPEKPRLLMEYLERKGLINHFDFRSDFEPFDKEDFYMAHTKDYVDKFFKGEEPYASSNGLRWSPEFAKTVRYTNASLYEAIKHALLNPQDICFSPTSGFHHACPNGGGGFCTFSGQVIAARKIWKEFGKRALFLDYDGHFGNSIEDSRKMFPDLNEAVFMNYNPLWGREYRGRPLQNALNSEGKGIVANWDRGEWDYVVFCHGADSHEYDDIGGGCTTNEWLDCAREVYECIRELNERSADINSHGKQVSLILALFGGYRSDDYNSVLSLHTASLVECLNILTEPKEPINYEMEVKERRR